MQSKRGGWSSSKERTLYTKSSMEVGAFRRKVWAYYKNNGRHDLPWRKTYDPYKIFVSEVMLQQTQVERVVPYYKAWITKYPTIETLAAAPLGDVLRMWQGLGYNRRAKMLHEAAKMVLHGYNVIMPRTVEELIALPGVGPYTARAVLAFSQNQDTVFIETNLRTAILHHFFAEREDKVSDTEILAILEKTLPKRRSREWYSALMDYGAFLKRSGVRINAKSKTYTKQAKFAGSNRQARGAILKELAKGDQARVRLVKLLGDDRVTQMEQQLEKLLAEGFIEKLKGNRFRLP
jgi:A/G-specific adenine glycosylase